MMRNKPDTIRALRLPLAIGAAGLVTIFFAISALALTLKTDTEPDTGGTYIEGVVGSPLSINPVLSSFNEVDRDLVSLVFSGLFRLNERGEPVPDLAGKWELSPDGKSVLVQLRRDAFWHDGAPFGARDVVFTIKSIQDPKFQGSPDLAETWKGIIVEQVDDYTVRFNLRDSFAPFVTNLAVGMLPEHILKDVPGEALPDHPFRSNPIGTGPFKMKDAAADSITLEANAGYYGRRPYLKTLRIRFYQNRPALLNGIKLREIQGAAGVTEAELAAIGKSREYAVYTAPRTSFTILFLNNKSSFFKDKQVRQAMAYAINRQRVVDVAVSGLGVVADSPVPPGTWAADAEIQKYDYNPDKAKSLLDAAGWTVGGDGTRAKDGVNFRFPLLTNDDPTRVKAAEEVARQLRAIGIRAEVSASGYSGLIEKYLAPRQFDAILFGVDPGGDPDGYSNWHSSQARSGGFNFISFNNKRADELLEQARATNDPINRARAYNEFQAIFAEEVPSVLLYYPLYSYAVDRQVNGVDLRLLFDASDRFRSISGWYVKMKRVMSMRMPSLQ